MVRKEVITAKPDESILELLQTIEEYDTTNIPVVDDDNKLCGLITSSSLINVLSSPYLDGSEQTEEMEVL